MKITLLKYFILFFTLSSCILHRAYVPSTFEPVVVDEKNEQQFSLTFRPFDYLNVDYTRALTNHLAIRGTAGGTYQLYNTTASLIYFNKIKDLNYFIAPLYNYQNNQLIRRIGGGSSLVNSYNINYNCVYNTVGLAIGLSIPGRVQHHFMLKSQYNFVDRYHFQYYKDNGSGSDYGFRVIDDEVLNKRIPSFLSIEPSYAILFKAGSKNYFKIQAGLSICEAVYSHRYSYFIDSWRTNKNDRIKEHPTNWPVNISVGFIFSSKKEKA